MNKSLIPIADQLQEIRECSRISKSDLAQFIGTSLVAVEQWGRSSTSPSSKQQGKITELFEKVKKGEILRKEPIVLQNGTFASMGATRQALKSDQADLFTDEEAVELLEAPTASILSLIKNGRFISNSQEFLQDILNAHREPAKTVPDAQRLEVSAGKNTYTYDAHTYHTKVPPQGIVEFIEHYLPEGGVVLDPFGGSGMTGVAARTAGVDVILNELSPAACFISHNFTESVSPYEFAAALKAVISVVSDVRKQLYTTQCRECGRNTEILYTVWSYHVSCPQCSTEFLLWDHCRKYGRTVREHKILKEFPCPSCGKNIKKRLLSRTVAEPVILGYKCCGKTQVEHPLTESDLAVIRKADSGRFLLNDFYPSTILPEGVNLNQPRKHSLTTIDKFYTSRNLSAMSHLWRGIHRLAESRLASVLAFVFTSLYQRVTRLSEFRFWGGSGNTARFNVPFIFNEANVFVTFERKAASILDHLETTAIKYTGKKSIVCNSATDLYYLPDESIDFVFTDPPFGANINYSEMNILWEAWLGEFTDNTNEAIVNKVQGKQIEEYGRLMEQSLAECYRVLRHGHWMLLVFMNSSEKVWNALKVAVRNAGFVTERLDIFDKQHGTFKQFVSDNTAGCDLVLHCRKLKLDERIGTISRETSTKDSVSLFVNNRNGNIPVTEYLHVARDNEPDLRRLYSEWLASALPREQNLVDFATFRKLVHESIEKAI
ncbi:DNA methyltransferase [Candidatus Thiosymbion oneisti]|uniref:DNA methyltransferase n=1 Tax=Candidatus Thiosymbion oneisti TaxID=589554 RepID=UPI000A67B385|nr:DNA methyltransferase [Candidatus Thiosymbion oneisti]